MALFGLIKSRSFLSTIPDAGARPLTPSGASGSAHDRPVIIEEHPLYRGVRIGNGLRDEAPKFRREYRAGLGNGISVEINARSYSGFLGGRSFSGWLYQPNGRMIMFAPNEIADKIIRPEIVAAVEQFMVAVRRWDREFMATATEFTDENGNTWVLKKSLPRELRAA